MAQPQEVMTMFDTHTVKCENMKDVELISSLIQQHQNMKMDAHLLMAWARDLFVAKEDVWIDIFSLNMDIRTWCTAVKTRHSHCDQNLHLDLSSRVVNYHLLIIFKNNSIYL